MNYHQLIRNWHEKASDEDYFSKYVFEYLAFIGLLKRVLFVDQDTDTGAIRNLKHYQHLRDLYLSKISSSTSLTKAWESIKVELDKRSLRIVSDNTWEAVPIQHWKCTHNPQNWRKHVCDEQGKIHDLNDWENMVEFWHSIRNNLFHGSKNPEDARDQFLVENGFKTLHPLVEMILEDIG